VKQEKYNAKMEKLLHGMERSEVYRRIKPLHLTEHFEHQIPARKAIKHVAKQNAIFVMLQLSGRKHTSAKNTFQSILSISSMKTNSIWPEEAIIKASDNSQKQFFGPRPPQSLSFFCESPTSPRFPRSWFWYVSGSLNS
jgi:hypothetical protein